MSNWDNEGIIEHRSLQSSQRTARELGRMAQEGLLDLNPSYQRGSVWTEEQRRNLVRSWAAGIPVPAVCIASRNDGEQVTVVDGKQRIECARDWFAGRVMVPAAWFKPEHVEQATNCPEGTGVTFDGLSAAGQRLFANKAFLPVIEFHPESEAEEAAMYLLLERSGTPESATDLARVEAVAR